MTKNWLNGLRQTFLKKLFFHLIEKWRQKPYWLCALFTSSTARSVVGRLQLLWCSFNWAQQWTVSFSSCSCYRFLHNNISGRRVWCQSITHRSKSYISVIKGTQLIPSRRGASRLPPCRIACKNFFAPKLQSQWSKGKHSWLWIWRPRVRFPVKPTFSLRKRKGTARIWTQDPWFQSQLCLPLDHKLMKNAWKIKKILGTYFQIQNSLNYW